MTEGLNEVISTGAGGGIGVLNTTYETKQLHHSKELILTIKQIGYLMSGTEVYVEDATKWGDPAISDQVDPSTGATIAWTHTYKFTNIDPDISKFIITMAGTPIQTTMTERHQRILIVNFDDHRGPAPTTPAFGVSTTNPNKYVMTGVDSSMEYRLKSGRTWTSCVDGENLFDIPSAAVKYYVRIKATDTQKESQVKELTLAPIPPAPNVSYGTSSELFSGLTTAMEVSINNEPYIPVTEEFIAMGVTPYIEALPQAQTTSLKIRKKATETSPESRTKELIVYPRSTITTNPIMNANTYTMAIRNGYQYKIEGDIWRSTSSSTTSLYFGAYAKEDRDSFVDIRAAATATKAASWPVRYIIKKMEPQVQGLSIDYAGEALMGFDTNRTYQYKPISSTSWSNATLKNGKMSLGGLISSTGEGKLDVRYATTSTSPAGAPTRIVLPKRPAAPSQVKFVYNISEDLNKGNLINATEEMEFKHFPIETWTRCSSLNDKNLLDLFPVQGYTTICYVRYKGTDSSFPSMPNNITTYGILNAPTGVSYNADTEILTGLNSTREYSINGRAYEICGDKATMDIAPLIDAIPSGGKTTLAIRTMRTENRPVSKELTYVFYSRQVPPTGLVFDNNTKIMTGLKNTMQYRELGTEKWTSFSGTTYNFTGVIKNRPNVVVEIRYRAVTGKFAASKSTVINLY